MTDKCKNCGRTESQITADAKTLGLLEDLRSGQYTCCQISEWADEQWLAWTEATQQDGNVAGDVIIRPEFCETGGVLVPVRFRFPQVPWFKDSRDPS
jgi:hypothetical protein